jgi:hypothetical protein
MINLSYCSAYKNIYTRFITGNVTYISEALGHSETRITGNYPDSFQDEQKKEIAKKLTDW